MASSKAVVAAEAVNSLLHLSSSDQESLLGIVEYYFTTPDSRTDNCDCDLDGSDDSDLEIDYDAEHGTFIYTISINCKAWL